MRASMRDSPRSHASMVLRLQCTEVWQGTSTAFAFRGPTRPQNPETVVSAIVAKYAIRRCEGDPERKKHGRLAYTLSFKFGDTRLDLSFMPRIRL
jgi:hypothetical protein